MKLIEKQSESCCYSETRGNSESAKNGTGLESVDSDALKSEIFVEAVKGFRWLWWDGESGDSVGILFGYSEMFSRVLLHCDSVKSI